MTGYICNVCNRDFKYKSHFKRHQECKSKCKKEKLTNHTTKLVKKKLLENNNPNDLTEKEINNIKNIFSDTDINKLELIYALVKDEYDKRLENININKNSNQFICYVCDKVFAHKRSLQKHINLGRCKNTNYDIIDNDNGNSNCDSSNITNGVSINKKGIRFNDLINNDITNNDITNNGTINNITTSKTIIHNQNIDNSKNVIANITFNVNPFGCESLEHISIKDFKSIFNDIRNIVNKLCYHVYNKHLPNINFFKNNLKQQIVLFLNRNMEITRMTEKAFIVSLKYLLHDICIELFHMFKDKLTDKELLKYMKNLVSHRNLVDANGGNNSVSQEANDAITNLLDDAFRNKDIKIAINTIVKNISKNHQEKAIKLETTKTILENKKNIANEYSIPDKNNSGNKHLNTLKIKAEDDVKIDEDATAQRNKKQLLDKIKFDDAYD